MQLSLLVGKHVSYRSRARVYMYYGPKLYMLMTQAQNGGIYDVCDLRIHILIFRRTLGGEGVTIMFSYLKLDN